MGSSYNPLSAPAYIAGTISLSGGQVSTPLTVLSLVQAQLEANCPGACLSLLIQADNGNNSSHTLKIGAPSTLGGALSDTNYGVELVATAPGNIYYRSSAGSGISVDIGNLQVFISQAGKFHVEIY